MTAQKYLQLVRRSAIAIGYARAIGREGEAAAIFGEDLPIEKLRGVTAKSATAEQIEAAIRAIENDEPDLVITEEQKGTADK